MNIPFKKKSGQWKGYNKIIIQSLYKITYIKYTQRLYVVKILTVR